MCSDLGNCGGFTVFMGVCYFKSKDCYKDIINKKGAILFVLQGKVNNQHLLGYAHMTNNTGETRQCAIL